MLRNSKALTLGGNSCLYNSAAAFDRSISDCEANFSAIADACTILAFSFDISATFWAASSASIRCSTASATVTVMNDTLPRGAFSGGARNYFTVKC
jgi:hypothetical protein